MVRATRNEQVAPKMPWIRGNIKCDTLSYPPCSCACWKVTQQLNDKVKFLELQMKKYGRIIREFEEMRMRVKWEAEENGAEDADNTPNTSTPESTGSSTDESDNDLDESSVDDNMSETNVENDDDSVESQSEGNESQNDSSMSYMNFEESIRLASTPNLSFSESTTGSSGTSGSSDDSLNTSNSTSYSDSHDTTTNSFEKNLKRFLHVFGDREDEDEQVEQTEPKRKRRKRNSFGEVPSSLPRNLRKCPRCSVVFKRICSLRRHVQNCQAQNRKPFNCDQCSQVFPYKNSLDYHMESVHEQIRHFCNF